MNVARYEAGRFWLSFPYSSVDLRHAVKRIEGRRWHPEFKAWSVPGSLRAWRQLERLGFLIRAQHLEHLLSAPGDKVYHPDLRDYQNQGVHWLARRDRALLYDAQGTGKTAQAVVWAAPDVRVVVVAPYITLPQWAQSVARWAARPVVIRPTTAMVEGWSLHNYEIAKKVQVDGTFTLIVDEGHFVKNPKAQRTKAVLALARRAQRVLVLTGTPVKARPVDLWTTFLLMGERDEKEFFFWAQRYCAAVQTDYGWDFSGASHLEELGEEIQHFALRREKDILNLPPKVHTTLVMQDTKKATAKQLHLLDKEVLNRAGRGESLSAGAGFASIQRLRAETGLAKVSTTAQWVVSQGLPENKVVIFGEFLESLHQVGDAIIALARKEGTAVECGYLVGDTPHHERRAIVDRFRRQEESLCVVLATYAVAATGTDGLQDACHTIVLHDLPWTPTDLEQAEDRLHRGGQAHSVQVVTVLAGTQVEEVMLDGLRNARDVVQSLIHFAQHQGGRT